MQAYHIELRAVLVAVNAVPAVLQPAVDVLLDHSVAPQRTNVDLQHQHRLLGGDGPPGALQYAELHPLCIHLDQVAGVQLVAVDGHHIDVVTMHQV